MKFKIFVIILSLALVYSFSYAQAQKAEAEKGKKGEKWANTTWKKVGGLLKEKRSFQVEKATTVAGVRGAEAEDNVLKQLYYRGKGQFPTRLELKNAVEMLKQIIKSKPDAPNVPETKFYIAQIYEQLGETQNAIDTYEDITKDYPGSELVNEASVRIGELKK